MDEPTTDIDPIGKLGKFTIAKKIHESSQFTLLIVEVPQSRVCRRRETEGFLLKTAEYCKFE